MSLKHEHGSSIGYFTIGIATLFLAGFLLLVVFGAQSYRNVVSAQNSNMTSRTLLSYIATCVKASDTENAVSVTETADGQILKVADGNTGYGLFIYWHDGKLLEEFTSLESQLSPESAEVIGYTDVFSVREVSDGLISVTTDAGRILLHIRSEGGGDS